jgi:3-oxoacyl-[acyl-carrier-protein] synthase III
MAYPAGIRKATKLTLEAINKKPKDFRRIITNNYILPVAKQSVKLCGFDEAQGYYENIPRFAHTIAGDVMINLCDLHSKEPFKSDDLVFLLATSPSSWHTVALRKT